MKKPHVAGKLMKKPHVGKRNELYIKPNAGGNGKQPHGTEKRPKP